MTREGIPEKEKALEVWADVDGFDSRLELLWVDEEAHYTIHIPGPRIPIDGVATIIRAVEKHQCSDFVIKDGELVIWP